MRPVGRIPETTLRGTLWGAGRPTGASASAISALPGGSRRAKRSHAPYPTWPPGSSGDVLASGEHVHGRAPSRPARAARLALRAGGLLRHVLLAGEAAPVGLYRSLHQLRRLLRSFGRRPARLHLERLDQPIAARVEERHALDRSVHRARA